MESAATVADNGAKGRSEYEPRGAGSADERTLALAARLAEDLAAAWRRGERPSAEALLATAPDLADCPRAALTVVREEIRRRREFGPPPQPDEYRRRFPLWESEISALFAADAAGAPPGDAVLFPSCGETLGDCRLLQELGRGAQGRVFLAAQASLADRLVVLKMGPSDCHEHLALARLLHTHIVPLHFVQEHPVHNLRVLCMPYLGGATLAQLREELKAVPVAARTGKDLLAALDRVQQGRPPAASPSGPARAGLAACSFVEAVCHVGACVADALHYAHERRVLHLDLKPSNVLIAGDGQPLLLDFHLARPPLPAGALPPGWFGGTPGYMAPEQREALRAVRARRPLPVPLDGRADVYALGVVLFEMLGGEPTPRGLKDPRRRLRRANREVSPGLADILARCMNPDRGRRYPQAGALAEDLRRHLAHRPLLGAPNRSLLERWRKWRRRRPHALLRIGVVLLLVSAAAAGTALARAYVGRQRQDAEAALAEGDALLRRGLPAEAERPLARGQELAARTPWSAGLQEVLAARQRDARRAELAQELHRTADAVRFFWQPDALSPDGVAELSAACGRLWDRRHDIVVGAGDDADEQVRSDLRDLAVLWVSLQDRVPGVATAEARRRDAETLDEAEAMLGPSPALCYARSRQAGAPAADLAPQTAWDHYALGRALLRDGDLPGAAAELDRAVVLQPQGFWPNFYQGACAYQRGRPAEAEAAFRVCVALAPDCAPCRYNHGLAEAGLGRADRARADYDKALDLDPSFGPAWLNRGVLDYQEKRWEMAQDDLRQALARGAEPAAAHYNLALTEHARGDDPAAADDARAALRCRPGHAGARELLGRLSAP